MGALSSYCAALDSSIQVVKSYVKYVLKYTTLLSHIYTLFNVSIKKGLLQDKLNMHSISQLCGSFDSIYLNKVQCNEKTKINLMLILIPSTKPFIVLTVLYISDQAVVGITINVLYSISVDEWLEHKLLIGILRMSFLQMQ